jgi:hypothetical protein
MTARPRRLDQLPLFATDAELAGAILGDRRAHWPKIATLLETKGLPKVNLLMGGRYVPAVKQFFDADNGVLEAVLPSAPDGVEDLSAWKSPRGRTRRA